MLEGGGACCFSFVGKGSWCMSVLELGGGEIIFIVREGDMYFVFSWIIISIL